MQISALLNIAPLLSIGEINVPLPMDDEAWSAPHTSTNRSSAQHLQTALNFRAVLDSLLSKGKLPQPLSSFGFSIIAHTLYRYDMLYPFARLARTKWRADSALMPRRSIPSFRNPIFLVILFTGLHFPRHLTSK